MRPAVLRRPLALVLLVLCYLGAAIHFYVGAHLFPDTLAGDLLGTSLGCLAVGLFVLNDTQRRSGQKASVAPGVAFDGAAGEKKTSSAMLFARQREVERVREPPAHL